MDIRGINRPALARPLPNAANLVGSGDAGSTSSAATGGASVGAAAPAPGVVADLDNLSLRTQLDLGKSLGVFTKITYNQDGTLGRASKGGAGAGFVDAAVSNMRDFEEGFAALKSSSSPSDAVKANDFWTKSVRGPQQAAAKLNVRA